MTKKDDIKNDSNDLEEKNKINNNIYKSEVPKNINDINNFFNENTNNKKLIKDKETLEQMSKEALIYHCMTLNSKFEELENYLKKYTNYKKGFDKEDEFDKKNKDEIIKELKEKINKLNIKLEEQIIRNNRNEVIIGTQNRRIERLLQKDNIILSNFKNNKRQSSSILTPNKSTLYNSSAVDFYSNLSENNNANANLTSNKNNNFIVLKKSNSCMSINKQKQRPLSNKLRKFPENNISRNYKTNNTNKLSKEFSSKLREFHLEHEKSLINKTLGKK